MPKIKKGLVYKIPEDALEPNDLTDPFWKNYFTKLSGFKNNGLYTKHKWIKSDLNGNDKTYSLDVYDELMGFPWYLRQTEPVGEIGKEFYLDGSSLKKNDRPVCRACNKPLD